MTPQKGSDVHGTSRANGGFSANVTARKGVEVSERSSGGNGMKESFREGVKPGRNPDPKPVPDVRPWRISRAMTAARLISNRQPSG
jgi:hypothetical protein